MPDDGIDEPEGSLVVAVHDGPKGRFVAGLRAPQQVGIWLGVGRLGVGHRGEQTSDWSGRFRIGPDDARIERQVHMNEAAVQGGRVGWTLAESVGFAERDVASDVLVEQGVVEESVRPAKRGLL